MKTKTKSLTPGKGRAINKPYEGPKTSAAGIVLPDISPERDVPQYGEIVAVATESPYEAGTQLYWVRYAGHELMDHEA